MYIVVEQIASEIGVLLPIPHLCANLKPKLYFLSTPRLYVQRLIMRKYKIGNHIIYYVSNRSEVPLSERTSEHKFIINELNSQGIVTGGICGNKSCENCPLMERFPGQLCNDRAQHFIKSLKITRTKALQ